MSKVTAMHVLSDPGLQKQLEMQRARLMETAVRYVRDGQDGSSQDRTRTASSLSGIPINLIEVELKK